MIKKSEEHLPSNEDVGGNANQARGSVGSAAAFQKKKKPPPAQGGCEAQGRRGTRRVSSAVPGKGTIEGCPAGYQLAWSFLGGEK